MTEPMKESTSKIDDAEEILSSGIAKFETAMEHLAEKVEEGSERLQHVIDLSKRQKEQLLKLRDKSREVLEPVRGVVTKAQRNPRPYVFAAAGVFLGVIAFGYFLRNSDSERGSKEESPERPERPKEEDSTGGYYDNYDTNEYVG